MALSFASNRVAEDKRELIEHGTALFPLACYHDDLRTEEVAWHWHEEMEMIRVTQGEAITMTDTQHFVMKAGHGCLINRNVRHSQKNLHPGNDCRFHSITFHPRLAGGSLESIFWEKYIRPVTDNGAFKMMILNPADPCQGQILDQIEDIWQSCVQETEFYEIRARYALSMIFAMTKSLIPVNSGSPARHETIRAERMKSMLEYIRKNLDMELSVDAIGKAANVSESECLRTFRKIIHTTPMRYVQQLRIQKAMQLLSSTPLPISDIGTACGFLDMSYFSRVFRSCCGMTPSQYRKRSERGA